MEELKEVGLAIGALFAAATALALYAAIFVGGIATIGLSVGFCIRAAFWTAGIGH